jgi:hypothetical protein
MTYERVQKASSWSSQPQEKTSPFARRPFTVPAQAPTQQEIEDEAIQQNKLEAFGLELQAKHGTITPEGQERLTVLQAKMDAFWQQRRESIERRGGNILQRLLNQGGTSKDEPPPMIQTKLTIGEPGDQYEQEADQVAARVVNQINAPAPQQSAIGESVQHEEQPEEEKLMTKPEVGIVQRQPGEDGMAATPDLEASIQQARGSGQPLADSVREPMEQAFGADFSSVKVHTDAQSDQLNQSIQAKAFTTGQDIFFRQGAYEPGSRGGQELIAHELTHVVQQNGSVVQQAQTQARIAPRGDTPMERAVNHLQPCTESDRLLQRYMPYNKVSADPNKDNVIAYFKEFDKAIQKAYAIVSHRPMLEDFGVVDGHIEHWRETWQAYLNKQKPSLPAAAFGYAVESITTLIKPDPSGDLTIVPQQTRGGTRPDFVLATKGGQDIAWLDITASDSAGHIFQKDGWNRIAHYGEFTYPSTTLEQIATLSSSEDAKNFSYEGIDPEAVKQRLAKARMIQNNRRAYWKMAGEKIFSASLPKADPVNKDRVRATYTVQKLNEYLGATLLDINNEDHLRIAASVLVALGRDPKTHGFAQFSISRSLGESFLQENDPNIGKVDTSLDEAEKIKQEIVNMDIDMDMEDNEEFFTIK